MALVGRLTIAGWVLSSLPRAEWESRRSAARPCVKSWSGIQRLTPRIYHSALLDERAFGGINGDTGYLAQSDPTRVCRAYQGDDRIRVFGTCVGNASSLFLSHINPLGGLTMAPRLAPPSCSRL